MKILNIHIDDFGKLSNFDMDFTVNPVVVSAQNGWGKSTLASFIRVMFYGFEGESKKKNLEKERFRFRPWNKGNFGGKIIFEAGGKEYELTRHFGIREKEDTGSIIDISTMLESTDYTLNGIGEQIFGIDEESFVRTVFARQNKADIKDDRENIGDGIAAKIGNLTDATDDVYNYDKVHDKLVEKARELKAGYKKGTINELEAQKTEVNSRINAGRGLKGAIENIENNLLEEEGLRSLYIQKEKELEKELQLSGKKEAWRIWLVNYEHQMIEKNNLEKKAEQLNGRFSRRIPGLDEVRTMQKNAESLRDLRIAIEEYNRNSTEVPMLDTYPDDMEISACQDKVKQFGDIQSKIQEKIYEIKTQEDRSEFVIEQRNREYECKLEMAHNDYINRKNEAEKRIKGNAAVAIITGIILLIISGISFAVLSKMAGVVLAGISFVLLITGLLQITLGVRSAVNKVEKPEEISRPDYSDIDIKINGMKQQLNEMNRESEALADYIRQFFIKYGMDYSQDTAAQVLYALKESAGRRTNDVNRKKENADKVIKSNELESQIVAWFEEVGAVCSGDYIHDIGSILEDIKELDQIKNALKQLLTRIEAAKEQEPAAENVDVDEIRDSKVIEQERENIAASIQKSDAAIRAYQGQLEELKEKLESVEEDEELLEQISDKIDEKNHKYDIITKTADYMEMAKARLTSRYMQPISDSFKRYFEYICEDEAESFSIDANINVTKEELGERRNTAFLSKGYRDLIDIALRMALIDAMYEGEKPFVILDDPFVNLDTGKIERAKEFIAGIAKEYQVIYFTCHESRA